MQSCIFPIRREIPVSRAVNATADESPPDIRSTGISGSALMIPLVDRLDWAMVQNATVDVLSRSDLWLDPQATKLLRATARSRDWILH